MMQPEPARSSPTCSLGDLSVAEQTAILECLTETEALALLYDWPQWARPEQLPPPGEWRTWLILAGRGWGKTRTGAEWIREQSATCGRMALVAATAADARDTMVEGESGLLAISSPYNRPHYEPSKRRLTWPNGAQATTYSADEPDRLRGPQHEAAWADEIACVVAGTMVRTATGERPIETITPGDMVWTRDGLQVVRDAWLSSPAAAIWELITEDGRTLRGTGNHPVWTVTRGFVPLSSLRHGAILQVWDIASLPNGAEKHGTSTGTTTGTGGGNSCTERSTWTRTGHWNLGWTFTTETTIRRITNYLISSLSHVGNICGSIHHAVVLHGIPRNAPPASVLTGQPENLTRSCVPYVEQSSSLSELGPSSVLPSVNRRTNERDTRNRAKDASTSPVRLSRALYVASCLRRTIRELLRAQGPAVRCTVRSVNQTGTVAPVYNLSVSGREEYFANGILVHNSWRYPEAWDQLMFGLRIGADPRVVVTTTPRPTKEIKELIASSTTAVTRGTTFENRANLAPAFFEKIVARYEGTRIGRQELLAEILDDNPGALWQRSDLDTNRVHEVPELRRIVVAVDPAVSSGDNSADTGIVVAGIAHNGQGYVLEDCTIHGTPHEWGSQAVAAYARHRADRIVAEVNNGGEMVEFTVRTINARVPYKAVHASRGKTIRAEPVSALYEQGRVHHAGMFAELEDQLCGWEPGMKSPDRLDALVWALTDLMLDDRHFDQPGTVRYA